MTKAKGFTLIEVLIAMAILALAFTAVVGSITQHTSALIQLKNKTFATWVADNIITEVQLNVIKLPAGSEQTGTETMYQQTWYWHAQASSTENRYVKKVEVDVKPLTKGANVIHLMGYLRND